MKKLVTLLAGCLLLVAAQHQASAQRLENSSHSTIGYINSDGRAENSSHSTIGYFTSSGCVENSSHSTIGYISSGRFENSSHSTIGYYSGVREEWVAYYFFFFGK